MDYYVYGDMSKTKTPGVLDIGAPIRNVSRVDLVAAVYPATTSFTFLDILELRTNKVVDTTLTGNTMARSFAILPVGNTFHEHSHYSYSIQFETSIPWLSKLTPTIIDSNGGSSPFTGTFILRVHSLQSAPEPPPPEPIVDVIERKIQRAIQDALPPPKKKTYKIHLYVALTALIVGFIFWRMFGATHGPSVPR